VYNGLPTPYKESDNVTPKTFYESSFYCREALARTYNLEYGVDSVGLRYFSVYGPNERHKGRFANNISQFIWDMVEKGKGAVIYGDGNQTRDFTFVYDVVQANILALSGRKKQERGDTELFKRDGCKIYNVGTGIRTSFNRVVDIINKLEGTNIKPTYLKNPIGNYVKHTMADISLARAELGYDPEWKDVEVGIRYLLGSQDYSR
jgi:UDP-glucose 4-epimerase